MSTGGLSRARLGRMHDVMAGYVERGELPGLVTLVSRRGEVHVDAIGTTAIGGGDPMRRDTIFRITSMTKPITAAATMILVEECKLRLDEPVDRLLPELANRRVLRRLDGPLDDTVPANRPITVRDLLTFRMGFGRDASAPPDAYPIQRGDERARDRRLRAAGPVDAARARTSGCAALGTLPLMHQPGERWMYNTGSDVLGVLIARASGQPLETFLRERIFEPLGMKDTGLQRAGGEARSARGRYRADPQTGALELLRRRRGQPVEPPARVPGRRRRASSRPSTTTCAFGQMMLDQGPARRRAHPLAALGRGDDDRSADARSRRPCPSSSPASGTATAGDSACRSSPGATTCPRVPGRYGWDGGYGTSWSSDPARGHGRRS